MPQVHQKLSLAPLCVLLVVLLHFPATCWGLLGQHSSHNVKKEQLQRLSPSTKSEALEADHQTPHYWAEGHGSCGHYGSSEENGPFDLRSSFAWSWHHPLGKYHTLPYGIAIDDERSIYLTTDTSIWKLDPSGNVIWSFYPTPRATIYSAGSLLNGRMHFTSLDGRAWAISMKTGMELWQSKVCKEINHDNGFVSAHEGVVMAATDGEPDASRGFANHVLRAMSAETGATLWTFKPEVGLWNFKASFPDDGTVVYQDWEGRAYRHNLTNGNLMWKTGGFKGSWTDGSPLLADGVFYTVSAQMSNLRAPGRLTAHALQDGAQLWQTVVPMPPNNAPAYGRLEGHKSYSVVQPGGYQGTKGGPTGIWAYDAKSGELQWSFRGPAQAQMHQAGELEGQLERLQSGASGGYITNPWSAAAMSSNGIVYAGHEDGLFFALRDKNGDGIVEGEDEVSTFDTGAAYVGSSSPAFAPGFLAVANCDTLFVFNTSA